MTRAQRLEEAPSPPGSRSAIFRCPPPLRTRLIQDRSNPGRPV